MIERNAQAYFDMEVLVRVPGQPNPNRIGWLRAPMQIQGGDYFGRAGIEIDLGNLIRRLQEALEEPVVAE